MKDSDERTQYVVRLLKDTFWFFILSVYYFCESIILFCVPRKFRAKSAAGEIVLVTGAGGGLGRLMALKFAKLGATVIVWDIKKDGGYQHECEMAYVPSHSRTTTTLYYSLKIQ